MLDGAEGGLLVSPPEPVESSSRQRTAIAQNRSSQSDLLPGSSRLLLHRQRPVPPLCLPRSPASSQPVGELPPPAMQLPSGCRKPSTPFSIDPLFLPAGRPDAADRVNNVRRRNSRPASAHSLS